MREILLVKGRGVALVDDADYDLLSSVKWYFLPAKRDGGYAFRDVAKRSVLMHRVILGLTDRRVHVDHVDGNGLNNQRSNLRACSHAENLMNTWKTSARCSSVFKGVRLHPQGRWVASVAGRYLGLFDSEMEAARAYDAAAREHCGEFARLNFPRPGEQPALTTPTPSDEDDRQRSAA